MLKEKTAMRSDMIKAGYEKAPHRALLRATGVTEEDMGKPFVAIVNSYVDIVPGHVHLNEFGKIVKDAVRAAGGVARVDRRLRRDDDRSPPLRCHDLYPKLR